MGPKKEEVKNVGGDTVQSSTSVNNKDKTLRSRSGTGMYNGSGKNSQMEFKSSFANNKTTT